MKKLLVLLICLSLLLAFAGCSLESDYEANNSSNNEISQNPESNEANEQDESVTVERSKHHNLDLFIAKYNKYAKTKITDPKEIDIQSDEYYRTEFRLNAFQNAPSYIANIGNETIELINNNYAGLFGSDLRVYALVGDPNLVTEIFEAFCKAGDQDITEEDFADFYEYDDLVDGDCRIVIGDVSGYVLKKDDKFDILLDVSPDYFDQESNQH